MDRSDPEPLDTAPKSAAAALPLDGPEGTPPDSETGDAEVLGANPYADVVPETISRDDPVARRVCGQIEDDLQAAALEIPRLPHVAAPILEFVNNPRVSNQEVIRYIRMDPVLAGRVLETANSAVFAGSQPIASLQMAVLRLGLRKVSEIALELSSEMKVYHGRKRGALLDRLWKFSLGTAFACESLAQHAPREAREGAFLAGLFHAVASPAIVNAISRLERRSAGVPPQTDERVLGLMNLLSTELTLRILESWYLPKEIQDAIRLQDSSARERRGRPLAQLLVCGKMLATELGIGTRPVPIEVEKAGDFRALRLDNRELLAEATRLVQAGLDGLPKK